VGDRFGVTVRKRRVEAPRGSEISGETPQPDAVAEVANGDMGRIAIAFALVRAS